VIKRIRFLARNPGVTPQSFLAAWPPAVVAECRAPAGIRPARVTVCTVLHGLAAPVPFEAIDIAWYTDAEHHAAHENWLQDDAGRVARRQLAAVADPDAGVVLTADEVVQRGADWLERHRSGGGAALKHMAVARRADGLSPEEFSQRWREHAGRTATAAGAAVEIPAAVRGRAYVQNHPRPSSDGKDAAFDAVNEVYLADLAALRARIAWFADNPRDPAGDRLFGENWFVAVREQVVVPALSASRISA
jgi:hypothetical protein